MKHFLKGTAAVVITTVISIVINVLCNMQGVDLNSTAVTFAYTLCGVCIYHILTRNETK